LQIIFDVDNVLADTIACWCWKVSGYLGVPLKKDAIRSHKIVGFVPIPAQQIFNSLDQVWSEWQNLPPTEEEIGRKVDIFRDNGFKVCIATSRPKRLTDCVLEWLNKMQIHYDSFHPLGPRQSKTQIAADSLVDDAPEEIRGFVRTGRTGFLYNQPWNAKATIQNAIRIKEINDVLGYYGLLSSRSKVRVSRQKLLE